MHTEPLDAFNPEAEQRIDVSSFVIPAEQMHVLGVLDLDARAPSECPGLARHASHLRARYLEREEERDCLERMRAAVNIVAEEQVVDICDVASSGRAAVLGKQAHQVAKLPVEVAEDLHRRRQL
jgi:hypothetical protein